MGKTRGRGREPRFSLRFGARPRRIGAAAAPEQRSSHERTPSSPTPHPRSARFCIQSGPRPAYVTRPTQLACPPAALPHPATGANAPKRNTSACVPSTRGRCCGAASDRRAALPAPTLSPHAYNSRPNRAPSTVPPRSGSCFPFLDKAGAEMAAESCVPRPLFGGAISTTFPARFQVRGSLRLPPQPPCPPRSSFLFSSCVCAYASFGRSARMLGTPKA